eukprot:TRINITY_DN4680_c0_g1_i4.p1 TRINITY_DN4680_c0_g1~~TRINITY_DN4680_c0_g1_i4.p1  ORF type:complete len:384 (+),score=125.91 TRINITY_DN4680_c0_g1_i4:586-1737(+)
MDYYEDLKADKTERHAYYYPTHYSTPGFVVFFLVRRIPEFLVKLQNAVFLPTDRVFRSMEQTWYATVNNGPDVKELIPEFYGTDIGFLVNSEKLELGVTNEGEVVDNVVLPEWARNPSDFLIKMRAALESNYVSANLHKWIDLIFGCKQRGDQAVLAQNMFYPLTYEEHVRWNEVRNAYERAALEVQVTEFGQTPVQLFKGPHPARVVRLFNLDPSIEGSETEQLLVKKLKVATKEVERLHLELEKAGNEQMKKISDQMRELKDLELRNAGHVDKVKEEHKNEVRRLQETVKTLEARLREKNFMDLEMHAKPVDFDEDEFHQDLEVLISRKEEQKEDDRRDGGREARESELETLLAKVIAENEELRSRLSKGQAESPPQPRRR